MKDTPPPQPTYYAPTGGLPGQTALHTGRAVFTEAYALIPQGVMTDIVTSYLPFWDKTRAWIIARPMSGFAETFSQYIMEVAPGGGSDGPEPDPAAEGVLFVVEGGAHPHARRRQPTSSSPAATPTSRPAPPGRSRNDGAGPGPLPLDPQGLRAGRRASTPPDPVVANERDIAPTPMPDTDGALGHHALRRPRRTCATTCT